MPRFGRRLDDATLFFFNHRGLLQRANMTSIATNRVFSSTLATPIVSETHSIPLAIVRSFRRRAGRHRRGH
jgi:hypothetical protein